MLKRQRRKRPSTWPDWLVPKRYPHFDQPIRDPDQIRQLVESPDQVARHAFLPFIRFEKMVRKFKRDEGRFVKKQRPLSYAGHTDSQILRHYAQVLSSRYEAILAEEAFGGSVLAYRHFDPKKCNIHFANDAFRWIEENAPCIALAFDVKDFFESLGHRLLKNEWKNVLGVASLPSDHYAVFKAVTRYAWVERGELFERLHITKKKLSDWRGPICTPQEFRSRVRSSDPTQNLVKAKSDSKGIPQGSPISALLSNVYMTPVDRTMGALASRNGAMYCRYSDDILIVCKPSQRNEMELALRDAVEAARLELHDGPGKLTVTSFSRSTPPGLSCDRPLQYLGFSFDGQYVRIRSQTVARFLRRMGKAVRREKHLAQRSAETGGDPRVRRKLLYSRYTHLGTNNFITGYARNAREVFERNAIRKQLKHHWRDLHAMLVLDR